MAIQEQQILNALLTSTSDWVIVFNSNQQILIKSDCTFQGIPTVANMQSTGSLESFFDSYGKTCPVVDGCLQSQQTEFDGFNIAWALVAVSDNYMLTGRIHHVSVSNIKPQALEEKPLDDMPHYILSQRMPILTNVKNIVGATGIPLEIAPLKFSAQKYQISDQANTLFLHCIAHDISTPLTSMLGIIELLLEQAQDESTSQNLQILLACSLQLSNQLKQVLNHLKNEVLPLDLQCSIFSVDKLIETIKIIFEPCFCVKSLQFHIDRKSAPSFLVGDKDKIQRILLNLISNAINYTESGVINLHVVFEKSEDKNYLKFIVQDTGCGISKNQYHQIFEAFHRSDNESHMASSGVGLGLSIVKKLIGIMKGEINIESTVGQGTTFTVMIPCELPTR